MHNFFFLNDTATTEIYTLSLHDALPISLRRSIALQPRTDYLTSAEFEEPHSCGELLVAAVDRKSTRLNSSHQIISYAVFCLQKKTPPFPRRHVRSTLCPPSELFPSLSDG